MNQERAQKIVEDILSRLCVDWRFDGVKDLHDGAITKISIVTEEPHLLIGEEGKTLLAINHLMKKILERDEEEGARETMSFMVDVNDHQEKRIEELKNKATIMAERARFFKSSIELEPMNPYERMIVHSFFSQTPDIKTESTGSGRERRVVMKFVDPESDSGRALSF
ncbi:MAG: hypothetical protein HY455_00435 [Parcubacteria group bacterium]|nr:hypothetical protein [Parcubacteria group bacterium]